MAKIKVWGINVYIMGADRFEAEWFDSKEERDAYAAELKTPYKLLRCRMMDEADFREVELMRKLNW